jgi:hypothetical protein
MHVQHPADIEPGGRGEGREEEHALLVLVDVVDAARGRLQDRAESAAVEPVADGGGRGGRAAGPETWRLNSLGSWQDSSAELLDHPGARVG